MIHSNQAVKAIETVYAGTRFRSRLEARWAMFFDQLAIDWQYEPEAFENNGARYLPDFLLTNTNTWVEVKGTQEALITDFQRMAKLLDWGSPMPGVDESHGHESHGLLILGPVPRLRRGKYPVHALIQHHKGLTIHAATFERGGLQRIDADVTCWSPSQHSWFYDSTWHPTAPAETVPNCLGAWAINIDPPSDVKFAYEAARIHRTWNPT